MNISGLQNVPKIKKQQQSASLIIAHKVHFNAKPLYVPVSKFIANAKSCSGRQSDSI